MKQHEYCIKFIDRLGNVIAKLDYAGDIVHAVGLTEHYLISKSYPHCEQIEIKIIKEGDGHDY
jgi:hypothetical protein